MQPNPLGPETLIRGAIRSRTALAPTLCSEYFARAGWLATSYSITSSPAEQAATTASPGAARRAVNGRSRPETPSVRRMGQRYSVSTKVRSPSVDAPFQARENVGVVVAR